MIKKLLPIFILLFILTSTKSLADEGYVSPESYAVNEADLTDYIDVPPYKRGPVYHMAKWWTDARYKREEPHHGEKHEIKVKQRMEYEKQLLEKQEENQTPSEE